MYRLVLLAAAAALAAALFLQLESGADRAKTTKTECPAEELCLVSIF